MPRPRLKKANYFNGAGSGTGRSERTICRRSALKSQGFFLGLTTQSCHIALAGRSDPVRIGQRLELVKRLALSKRHDLLRWQDADASCRRMCKSRTAAASICSWLPDAAKA